MGDRLDPLQCRALCSPGCSHGEQLHDEDDRDWRDDGTYQLASDTVVCDACYVFLIPRSPSGQALHHELPALIRRYRRSS